MTTAAELIAQAERTRVRSVTVRGVDFHVRRIGLAFRQSIPDRIKSGNPVTSPEWLALGYCNADGSDYWTVEDAERFAEADSDFAAEMLQEMFRALGMAKAAEEDAAKNSEATPSG